MVSIIDIGIAIIVIIVSVTWFCVKEGEGG
jgi:hypothetical protein